jgi:predicted small integral membrane protein
MSRALAHWSFQMMVIRVSKALMVLAMALFASLVAFGNITDYATNFAFVHHVFLMDTTFPGNGIMYRAITTEWIHHAGYIGIISMETATAVLCWLGGARLLQARSAGNVAFRAAKKWSVVGLTLGFLTWQVAFMSVGGEWFGMWMSKQWNGVPDAFRFFITLLIVLIYVTLPNDDKRDS